MTKASAFHSPRIRAVTGRDVDFVTGKAELRTYWGKALTLLRDLFFETDQVLVGSDSLTILYTNERSQYVGETFTFNAAGKVIRCVRPTRDMTQTRIWQIALLATLVVTAVALVFRAPWRDEYWTLYIAGGDTTWADMLTVRQMNDIHPPLAYFPLHTLGRLVPRRPCRAFPQHLLSRRRLRAGLVRRPRPAQGNRALSLHLRHLLLVHLLRRRGPQLRAALRPRRSGGGSRAPRLSGDKLDTWAG